MDKSSAQQVAQRLYDTMFEGAKRIIASGAEVRPIMLIEGADEAMLVPHLGGLPKQDVIALHRDAAAHFGAAVLVDEAWSLSGDVSARDMEALKSGSKRVKDFANREECVVFNVIVGATQFVAVCPIKREQRLLERGDLLDSSSLVGGSMVHKPTIN